MTIGELARQAGLSVSAIRYYQRRGLLPVAAKSSRGWQRFGSDDVARLKIVELAKSCGFSLNEVAVLIDALYGPASPTATWQAMGEAKRHEIDQQMARLRQMHRLLDDALAYCADDPDRAQITAIALEWANPNIDSTEARPSS